MSGTFAKTLTAVFLSLYILVFSVNPVNSETFSDISYHWARDSILRLNALEIVKGYNGRFNPGGGVTRAEFAAMIVSALGLRDQAQIMNGSKTGYVDVPPGHWASGFVIVASELGVINGYPDGSFKPSARIRRDEITSVLVRALKLNPENNNMEDPQEIFIDGEDIPAWAVESVKTAYAYKLISGYPDGAFGPQRNATRGETAVLIERVLEQLGAQYTYYGTVQDIDPVSNTVTLDILGQIESFRLKEGAEVKINGRSSTLALLERGTGVYIILEENGFINFLQTSEQADKRQSVKISSSDINKKVYKKSENISTVDEAVPGGQVRISGLASQDDEDIQSLYDMYNSNPGVSLNVTRTAIKAPEFVNITDSDGKGQIIAIIDTGVDPGHPDLRFTSSGKPKIVDWQDFTGEGDIDTASVVKPVGNTVYLANGQYRLGTISSVSGTFKYGYLREVDLVDINGNNIDINFNGKTSDIFGIIVADSEKSGIYDKVYVDTDDDKDFSDEKPLHVFSKYHEYASFIGNGGKDCINFVLTKIQENGSRINLGFDGNDHGTHVAGIAAANGNIKGVAPGAQIMALKAVDSAGYGDLGDIIDAITYAATHGAKIINLSVGIPVGDNDGVSIPSKLLNSLSEEYGVVFVVAAGNDGPGLASGLPIFGETSAVLTVGAYYTPEMWKTDYGWEVPSDNIWFYSSVGPSKDGSILPSVIAPGSVVSTVPLRGGQQYFISEGTSMAVPHVSGGLALLMEVADRNGYNLNPAIIKRAVELGAQPIKGYTHAEQGYGALNLVLSWDAIVSLKEAPSFSSYTLSLKNGLTSGVFFREGIPAKTTVYLKNDSKRRHKLIFNTDGAVTAGQGFLDMPPSTPRTLDLDISVPDEKGLFTTLLEGDDPSTYGSDFELLVAAVNPYELNEDNEFTVRVNGTQEAAQYKRYFFQVPANAEAVNFQLALPDGSGRSKLFIFDPDGKMVSETEFAGVNPGGVKKEVQVTEKLPKPGVWEVVIYTSAGLSAYNLDESNYILDVSLEGKYINELLLGSRNIIAGIIPQTSENQKYITVQVRDRITKRPYEGYIEINGLLYLTARGKVQLSAEAFKDEIIIRTVPESPFYEPWELKYIP